MDKILSDNYRRDDISMNTRKWTNEEIKEYRETHGSFFYCNKEDSNFLVPKTYGIGWTINWANPISWLFILLVVTVIIFKKIS
jgi:uncharacterized membrane protein